MLGKVLEPCLQFVAVGIVSFITLFYFNPSNIMSISVHCIEVIPRSLFQADGVTDWSE